MIYNHLISLYKGLACPRQNENYKIGIDFKFILINTPTITQIYG